MNRCIIGGFGLLTLVTAVCLAGCAAPTPSDVETSESEVSHEEAVYTGEEELVGSGDGYAFPNYDRSTKLHSGGCPGCGPLPEPWQMGPLPEPWTQPKEPSGGSSSGGGTGSSSGGNNGKH